MTSIVIEQRIRASPPTVYRYLTESDLWSKWQGSDAELDARTGGIFALLMPNGMKARGQFTELIPNRRVVFTWGWVDRPEIPPGSTVVTIDLMADGNSTVLTLTHADLPPGEVSPHQEGWNQHLPELARTIANDT